MAEFTDEYLLNNLEEMLMQYIEHIFDMMEIVLDMYEERDVLKANIKAKDI
jgi:hypothetical protein